MVAAGVRWLVAVRARCGNEWRARTCLGVDAHGSAEGGESSISRYAPTLWWTRQRRSDCVSFRARSGRAREVGARPDGRCDGRTCLSLLASVVHVPSNPGASVSAADAALIGENASIELKEPPVATLIIDLYRLTTSWLLGARHSRVS